MSVQRCSSQLDCGVGDEHIIVRRSKRLALIPFHINHLKAMSRGTSPRYAQAIIWLVPRAGKMKGILCSDWLSLSVHKNAKTILANIQPS